MKRCVLLVLVLLGSSCGAPVEQEGPEEASCTDPVVLGAAKQAMDQINKDRTEGYVYSLRDLANAHILKHGENSHMFYLTMNVLETNCSVLSKTHFKDCEVRDISSTPVYGQCKVAMFLSRVHRVVRLYKYNCVVRPETVSQSLEKFNKESGLKHHFSLLQVTRAKSAMGMAMIYSAEYTIQETTCPPGTDKPADCPVLDCEFAHKGFCRASRVVPPVDAVDPPGAEVDPVDVKCEIYESEAADREKKLHLLGGETDHSHNDTHVVAPETGQTSPTTPRTHSHAHSHDHGHGHDHVHAHHEKAHDHSGDHPHQHHQYQHAADLSTHQHDHELALDHNHQHAHLHEHEHHHHHHGHAHDHAQHHHPEGLWRQLPPLGAPVTLPAFPDVPAAGPEVGVTLPLKPDPQIPGQVEPTVIPFPTKLSAQCPPPLIVEGIVATLFLEDPEFKVLQ
ncbi:hypothetical protein WMY93_024576 [Mugilogobius chulae]|uniref:Cystatin fetuin-B-type domain-containing protein n=1 Tax=Mugilogobius chulae TaxID=88201 RepID=A0AAW0N018_9GOBI